MSNSNITRRDFIKGAAAATVSTGLLANAARGTESKTSDLVRVGIIGTGSQGILLLGQALKVPGVKVVAACDLYEPHLNRALVLAEDAEGYSQFEKLLERKDIDAVIVATPLYEHARISIAAMQAGKHVFCEKMMAFSIEEAKKMARTARDTKKVLQIGHQRRVNPGYQHAYKMINEEKVIGKVTQVRAQWHRNSSWRRDVPDKKWEKLLNWRMYKETSQGLMAELGSHQTDIVNWFLNGLPLSVMGVGGIDYWKDGRTTHDNVSLIYEYPNGVKFTYTSITTNEYDGFTEQFMGDQGTLITGPGKGLLFREAKADALVWAPMARTESKGDKQGILLDAGATRAGHDKKEGESIASGGESEGDYYTELSEYIDSVRTGKEPKCNAKVALDTCVVSLMANHAINTGKKILFSKEWFEI